MDFLIYTKCPHCNADIIIDAGADIAEYSPEDIKAEAEKERKDLLNGNDIEKLMGK